MGNIREPKYDNDLINLGYLKKALNEAEESLNSINDSTYSKSYTSPPTPPYYAGCTYYSGDKIYRCIKDRLVGSFTLDDFVVIYDQEQEKFYNENFLFLSDIDFKEQQDGKVESFYQTEDPNNEWTDSITKELHVGDFWRQKTEEGFKNYTYTKLSTNPITYEWLLIDVPIIVFNTTTGHKNIFLDEPSNYQKKDLWKQSNNFYLSTTDNETFDSNDWILSENDVSIKNLETFYYTYEEVDKKVEIENEKVRADIVKSEESITTFVEKNYTKTETTSILEKKVDSQGNTIDEIIGETTTQTPYKSLSELTVDVDGIHSEVANKIEVSDLVDEVSGIGDIVIKDAFSDSNIVSINIKGNTKKVLLVFPSNEIFPSDNLFPTGYE